MNSVAAENILIEACVGSLAGARIAVSAGADRIELNSALELEGLTPSAGLVQRVMHEIRIPVIAMARPRSGDFCYNDDDWETLKSEVRWLLDQGVDGIAFGCLDLNGQVDLVRCREIRELTKASTLVFHKAFDAASDWPTALELLIQGGVNRVMTSGQQPTAMDGLATIQAIVQQAAGRIEVLPAGGVSSENAATIVAQSGCDQLHGSFSVEGPDNVGAEILATIQALKTGKLDKPKKHVPTSQTGNRSSFVPES